LKGGERQVVRALNWLAIAYTAETLAAPALEASQPLPGIAAAAAAAVAFKASRVAARASHMAGQPAWMASALMAASSAAQAVAGVLAPDAVEVIYTIFLAAAAAYSYAAGKTLRRWAPSTYNGALVAAAGALLGALAEGLAGLLAGLLVYLAGLHMVLRSAAEAYNEESPRGAGQGSGQ